MAAQTARVLPLIVCPCLFAGTPLQSIARVGLSEWPSKHLRAGSNIPLQCFSTKMLTISQACFSPNSRLEQEIPTPFSVGIFNVEVCMSLLEEACSRSFGNHIQPLFQPHISANFCGGGGPLRGIGCKPQEHAGQAVRFIEWITATTKKTKKTIPRQKMVQQSPTQLAVKAGDRFHSSSVHTQYSTPSISIRRSLSLLERCGFLNCFDSISPVRLIVMIISTTTALNSIRSNRPTG